MGISFQFHHHFSSGRGTAVRQAHGPALGHELGPNGATSKDTIFLHIMKQPHVAISLQQWTFLVLARRYCGGPVHQTLSSLGAVTGLDVFWVVELKRDPHTPFELGAADTYYSS
jgi:hypothetical protein